MKNKVFCKYQAECYISQHTKLLWRGMTKDPSFADEEFEQNIRERIENRGLLFYVVFTILTG